MHVAIRHCARDRSLISSVTIDGGRTYIVTLAGLMSRAMLTCGWASCRVDIIYIKVIALFNHGLLRICYFHIHIMLRHITRNHRNVSYITANCRRIHTVVCSNFMCWMMVRRCRASRCIDIIDIQIEDLGYRTVLFVYNPVVFIACRHGARNNCYTRCISRNGWGRYVIMVSFIVNRMMTRCRRGTILVDIIYI